MLKPLNKHLLLKPIPLTDFIEGQSKFDEKGEVLALADGISEVEIGDVVYFDSYLCARYPSEDPENPLWLVEYQDLRAKDHEPKKIPE